MWNIASYAAPGVLAAGIGATYYVMTRKDLELEHQNHALMEAQVLSGFAKHPEMSELDLPKNNISISSIFGSGEISTHKARTCTQNFLKADMEVLAKGNGTTDGLNIATDEISAHPPADTGMRIGISSNMSTFDVNRIVRRVETDPCIYPCTRILYEEDLLTMGSRSQDFGYFLKKKPPPPKNAEPLKNGRIGNQGVQPESHSSQSVFDVETCSQYQFYSEEDITKHAAEDTLILNPVPNPEPKISIISPVSLERTSTYIIVDNKPNFNSKNQETLGSKIPKAKFAHSKTKLNVEPPPGFILHIEPGSKIPKITASCSENQQRRNCQSYIPIRKPKQPKVLASNSKYNLKPAVKTTHVTTAETKTLTNPYLTRAEPINFQHKYSQLFEEPKSCSTTEKFVRDLNEKRKLSKAREVPHYDSEMVAALHYWGTHPTAISPTAMEYEMRGIKTNCTIDERSGIHRDSVEILYPASKPVPVRSFTTNVPQGFEDADDENENCNFDADAEAGNEPFVIWPPEDKKQAEEYVRTLERDMANAEVSETKFENEFIPPGPVGSSMFDLNLTRSRPPENFDAVPIPAETMRLAVYRRIYGALRNRYNNIGMTNPRIHFGIEIPDTPQGLITSIPSGGWISPIIRLVRGSNILIQPLSSVAYAVLGFLVIYIFAATLGVIFSLFGPSDEYLWNDD